MSNDDQGIGAGQGNEDSERRCGFIAVIGATNAGKSTLVNALVGAKVSIVSRKVQTTRVLVRGIVSSGKSQLVFIDTPGIFQPRRTLDRAMVDAAWGGAYDADIVLLVVDAASGVDEDVRKIIEQLKRVKVARVLVLNKIDRVAKKDSLLALANQLISEVSFDHVFMVSALDHNGVDDLKAYLTECVPAGPWHFPDDEISDMPMRMLASEITREKVYNWLHEELPYAITVETTEWKELKNKSIRIEQTIFVERDSQKSIVLGKKGSMIKNISSEARSEISGIVEQPVHLFLFVKVRVGWQNDPERYREMGLNFPKK